MGFRPTGLEMKRTDMQNTGHPSEKTVVRTISVQIKFTKDSDSPSLVKTWMYPSDVPTKTESSMWFIQITGPEINRS